VELWSSTPCHLTLRWTAIEPVKTLHPKQKRGAFWYYDNKLCFVEWSDIEQIEAGDTLIHTFLWPGWAVCLTRWFIFVGTVGGLTSPSNTAIFSAHYEGAVDMITLGKFGEAEVLLGNVKLKEGANITITRIDGDNALEIAASSTPPEYTPPNLSPKYDALLAALVSGQFGFLASMPYDPGVFYLPRIGELALFGRPPNATTTNYLTSLSSYTNQTLGVLPATCMLSMPTPIIQGRYIFYPQGRTGGGLRGTEFYRYDLITNTWASKSSITNLNGNYRFDYYAATTWDGGDYIYCFGIYSGATNSITARYSISGNTWAARSTFPLGAYEPGGGVQLVGDLIYVARDLNSATFYAYSISGNSWAAMTPMTNTATQTGLVLNENNPDQIYAFTNQAGVYKLERYSISGNTWTDLSAVGPPPFQGMKGHYLAAPVPHFLLPTQGANTLYIYKL